MPKDEKDTTTEGVEVAEETTEAAATETAEKPPWEKEGEEFDPARAWQLIQNLRAENTKLKEKAANPTPAAPETETAPVEEKTASEPEPEQPEEKTETPSAEPTPSENNELAAAKLENTKLRALAAAGLDLDLIDLVPGADADSIAANIEKLKALSGSNSGKKNFPVNPAQGEKPATNPKEDWAKAIFG